MIHGSCFMILVKNLIILQFVVFNKMIKGNVFGNVSHDKQLILDYNIVDLNCTFEMLAKKY